METKKVLPILFAVMFFVMVGFGIIIPVLPFYAEELGASPTELGLLMAVYSVMQLIFAPFWGRLSDRIGRKPVMMLGIFGLSLSFIFTALATELWMVFAARIFGGALSAANMPTAMAYVADITTEEERGKGMGLIGASTGLGFVFGPAIGGIFSKTSLSAPFYVAGISSFLTLFLVFFVLKESLRHNGNTQHQVNRVYAIKQILSSPLAVLFFLQLFVTLSLSGLEASFAYFASEVAELEPDKLGYIFMIMGLASAIVQGGLAGKLMKKFGEGLVIQLGIIISAIGFFLILFTKDFITAAIFLSIFGIGNGIIRPSVSSLLTKKHTSGHGKITGLLSSFDSLGRIIGPPLGGWLFSIAIGLPYISGIILSAIAFILYQMYVINQKKNASLAKE
jgi:MFS transporter, DHA1 family, multidrug resistance protein